jgi:hypothetical protein
MQDKPVALVTGANKGIVTSSWGAGIHSDALRGRLAVLEVAQPKSTVKGWAERSSPV